MILFTLDLLVKAASNLTLREDWCTTFCIVILAYTCVPNMARKTKNPEKEFTMNQYTEVTQQFISILINVIRKTDVTN